MNESHGNILFSVAVVLLSIIIVIKARNITMMIGEFNRVFPFPWDRKYVDAIREKGVGSSESEDSSFVRQFIYAPETLPWHSSLIRLIGLVWLGIGTALLVVNVTNN